jgi:hypothetical protein
MLALHVEQLVRSSLSCVSSASVSEDEIAAVVIAKGGFVASVLPLLDHLGKAHPDVSPDDLVAAVDAAFARLYEQRRAFFAGHRWLSNQPVSVTGFLLARRSELIFDSMTGTWRWRERAWTENITVTKRRWLWLSRLFGRG